MKSTELTLIETLPSFFIFTGLSLFFMVAMVVFAALSVSDKHISFFKDFEPALAVISVLLFFGSMIAGTVVSSNITQDNSELVQVWVDETYDLEITNGEAHMLLEGNDSKKNVVVEIDGKATKITLDKAPDGYALFGADAIELKQ